MRLLTGYRVDERKKNKLQLIEKFIAIREQIYSKSLVQSII